MPDEVIRWKPLTRLEHAERLAQPQVAALGEFWRAVRARFSAEDEGFDERIDDRARQLAGLSYEQMPMLAKPLTVAGIQEIHALATREQTSVRAILAGGGFKYVAFPYGKFKDKPNTLNTRGKPSHEFCPPELVVVEMQKLIALHAAMPAAIPEVRAAFLISGLLGVHPFADGNGRVARVLVNWDGMRAGMPPIRGENGSRGDGWDEAVVTAERDRDFVPLVALIAREQEATVLRLMQDVEAPPPDVDIAGVIAHAARLERARTAWTEHSAANRARIAGLAAVAVPRLAELGARLGRNARVRTARHAPAVRSAFRNAVAAGCVADRRGEAAVIELGVDDPRSSLVLSLFELGASGTGAVVGTVQLRPPSAIEVAIRPILVVPQEREEPLHTRFLAWFEDALCTALSGLVRMS